MIYRNATLRFVSLAVLIFLFSHTDATSGSFGRRLKTVHSSSLTATSYAIESQPTADSGKTQIPFIDIERFLRTYLIPNIEAMYDKAASGFPDDHFAAMRDHLEPVYPFLFEGNVTGWDGFLLNVSALLKGTKSKFTITYDMIALPAALSIPSITLYEVISAQQKKPALKEFSKFWGVDFSDAFSKNTTFRVVYAKKPLVFRYDLWLQKKQQEIELEGITFRGTNEMALFVDPAGDKARRAFIHEFSHILLDKETEHLTQHEFEQHGIAVQQAFSGGGQTATTEVRFTNVEFGEMMAKLSELIVVPDSELYDYIHEVTINKIPQYQKLRQLIADLTVYRYLSEEHPDEFLTLKWREIADQEVESNLVRLSQEKSSTGENKLRYYLLFHVQNVGRSLKDVVFR